MDARQEIAKPQAGADEVLIDYDDYLERGPEVALDPTIPADRFDPSIVVAMRGYQGIEVFFPAHHAAASLWDYGEDDLANRALLLSEDELELVHGIAATFHNPAYVLPTGTHRVTWNHVTAFATLAYLDGRLRPLARTRRRPQKLRPDSFKSFPFPPSSD